MYAQIQAKENSNIRKKLGIGWHSNFAKMISACTSLALSYFSLLRLKRDCEKLPSAEQHYSEPTIPAD
jgi:hypothetical protein